MQQTRVNVLPERDNLACSGDALDFAVVELRDMQALVLELAATVSAQDFICLPILQSLTNIGSAVSALLAPTWL